MAKATYFVTYKGETHTLYYWAKKLGLTYNSLKLRIDYGWDPIKALETPPRHTGKFYDDKKEILEMSVRYKKTSLPKNKKELEEVYRDAWKEKAKEC